MALYSATYCTYESGASWCVRGHPQHSGSSGNLEEDVNELCLFDPFAWD